MKKYKLKQILAQLLNQQIDAVEAFNKIWGQEFEPDEQSLDPRQVEGHPLGSYIEDPISDAVSQYNVGWKYLHGKGGYEKDFVKAVEWFRKSADQGDSHAKKALWLAYCHGDEAQQKPNITNPTPKL